MDTKEFFELSPSETAVLWLASDLEQKPKDKPIVLPSGATFILMTILAEGVAARQGAIDFIKVLKLIEDFSTEAAGYLSGRDFYVRHDYTIRNLLKELENIHFPILPHYIDQPLRESERSNVAESYDYGLKKYKTALISLEEKGLVIDPPWYRHSALIGGLIILLGCFPLEINYRTKQSTEVIHNVEIKAKFWEYEKTQKGSEEEVHINIKIAKFIDDAIGRLGSSFVESWKKYYPDRTKYIQEDYDKK